MRGGHAGPFARKVIIHLGIAVFTLLAMVSTAHAQSYGPPTYSVGDTWKFSNDRKVEVVKVDENGIEVVGFYGCPTCISRHDKNLTILEIVTAAA